MNDRPIVATSTASRGAGMRRWRRWAIRLVVAVALYGALACWVAPPVLRSLAVPRLSALGGGPVAIDRISFHPFALRAQVTGFRLDEPDGRPLLGWSNVVADLELASLWRREVLFAAVTVDHLALTVRRDRDGHLNVLELLRRLTPPGRPASTQGAAGDARLFPVTIGQFAFTGGRMSFRDETLGEPFEARMEPIDFRVTNLTTRANGSASMDFAAADDSGGRLAWVGRVQPEPPSLEGTLSGVGLALAKPRPYTDGLSTVRPTDGRLSFSLPVRVAWTNAALAAALADARVTVSNLVLVERDSGAAFATLPRLAIEGISASLTDSTARVGSLRIDGGTVHVRRSPAAASGADGSAVAKTKVNVRGLLKPATIEALVQDLTGWRLALDEASVGGFSATFEDTSLTPPWRTEIRDVALELRKVSNGTNVPPAQVRTSFRWGSEGVVRLDGEATLLPAGARAKLGLESLDLAPLAPYAAQFTRLELHRGVLASEWEAGYGGSASQGSLVTLRGRLALRDFAATETVTGRDFIRWDEVVVNGVTAQVEPGRVDVDEVVLRKLQTSLVLTTNGQLNALQLLRSTRELGQREAGIPAGPTPTATSKATSVASTASAEPADGAARPFWNDWPMHLGRLRLEGVSLFAADDFYGGGFRTSVESLDGEITDLALPSTGPARLDLKGRLTASSGFAVTGTLQPDPAAFAADVRVTTHRADLSQFTPYTLRFAGYPVTRGELTAEVRYQIQGDALKAENKLRLDQFTLGRKTPSPDAVDLPLKLGVALLKDSDGRIELDLPLSGSLGDPKFRIMPVLWQVVRNLVVKAATAPFRFLGSIFGGGSGDELESVECVAGRAELAAGQTNRLRALVKALRSRPQLQLAIHPGFDGASDKPALATNQVERRLLRLHADEVLATGGPPLDIGTMTLTAEERERLIPQLYVKEFGALPDPAAPPDPVRLWERLVETVTVDPAEFRALARRRGEFVQSLLVADDGVAADRVSLVDDPSGTPADGKSRVAFRLE